MRAAIHAFLQILSFGIPPNLASGQFAATLAAADSANVARAAWSEAVKHFRNHDTAAALAAVERASSAWPSQPAYVWYRAAFAARLGDSNAVATALRAYAAFGLGGDLRDSAFDAYRDRSWFTALAHDQDSNRAVLARSHVRATLSDSTLWPEGVDHDSRSGNFYVASVRHRTIVEVAPDGRERELWPRGRPDVGSMLGVRVDHRRGVLWATTSPLSQVPVARDGGQPSAALLQIRIADGRVLRRWHLPPAPRHTPGDLAIGPSGDVFVTDSDEPVLYRLRSPADTLEEIRSPLFRSLQGIAPAPDGRIVYLADYSHGLLRVDLETLQVTRLVEPTHVTTLGCDGLAWHDGAIIAVQNGVHPARVMRFTLDRAGVGVRRADILDRHWSIADEPTIGTIAGDEFVYVANSQWEKHTADGAPQKDARLSRPVLLAVPLGRRQ